MAPLEVFEVFDTNRNGMITVTEWTFTARKGGLWRSRSQQNLFDEMQIFSYFDNDGDTQITKV